MQDSLDFGNRYDPFKSIEDRREERKVVIPPRMVKKRDIYNGHWVFAKCHLYPPPRKLNAKLPPRDCEKLHWQFETREELVKWYKEEAIDSNIWGIYRCFKCGKWGAECFPSEVSGQSSGKKLRFEYWKTRNGYD